jgi:pyruvate/2-oxoglutarate dehydrogenase complex dihydrolipoamide acyltransferase (E2) component
VGSRVVDVASGTCGEIVARNGAWLTMRTEAGVAGEAGEAGGGAVRAAPATAEEPESLTGHPAKKRSVGAEARQAARERQEEEKEERKRRT